MSDTIKTIAHAYRYDLHVPNEKALYLALVENLKGMGLKCFESHGGGSHWIPKIDNKTIELETSSLFDNQWNTAPFEGSKTGLRVFDWAQDYCSALTCAPNIKRGHWLEQNQAMRDIRDNMKKCRYCGAMEPAAKGYVFCPHCIDSAYLKPDMLHLTRMMAVSDTSDAPQLTAAEKEYLLPLYRDAQLHGSTVRGKARIKKEREDILKEYEKTIAKARTKRDGLIWLMDHGINTDNVIYYDHVHRFSFGWRNPVSDDVVSAILDVISEFPFPYEIKCDDGRKLSGG